MALLDVFCQDARKGAIARFSKLLAPGASCSRVVPRTAGFGEVECPSSFEEALKESKFQKFLTACLLLLLSIALRKANVFVRFERLATRIAIKMRGEVRSTLISETGEAGLRL